MPVNRHPHQTSHTSDRYRQTGKPEIQALLKKMDDCQNSLEGVKETEYKLTQRTRMKRLKHYCKAILFAFIGFLSISHLYAQQKSDWTDICVVVAAFDYENFPPDPYPQSNLFDGNYKTCWVQDISHVFMRFPGYDSVVVNIFAGYGKSKELYYKNSRPRTLRFSVFAGVHAEGFVTEIADVYEGLEFPTVQTAELADSFGIQEVLLKFSQKDLAGFSKNVYQRFRSEFENPVVDTSLFLKIEISDTRKGSKYDDVCVSEIFLSQNFISSLSSTPQPVKIYLNAKENALLIDDNNQQGITVYSDTSSVLQLIEVSPDKKWAIVISMPVEVEGRAETTYLLMNLSTRETANQQLEKCTGNYLPGNEMYFNTDKDGQLLLTYRAKDNEYYTITWK